MNTTISSTRVKISAAPVAHRITLTGARCVTMTIVATRRARSVVGAAACQTEEVITVITGVATIKTEVVAVIEVHTATMALIKIHSTIGKGEKTSVELWCIDVWVEQQL